MDAIRHKMKPSYLTALLFLAADIAAVVAAVVISVEVRYMFGGQFHPSLYWSLWPMMFLYVFTYAGMGLYPGVLLSPPEELKKTFWGTSLMFLALGAGTFMSKGGIYYSRLIFLMSWTLTVIFVPLARAWVRRMFGSRPWWGYPAVILGNGAVGSLIARNLKINPKNGLRPVVLFQERTPEENAEIHGVPVVGLDRFYELADRFDCGYAVVAMPECDKGNMRKLVERLGHHFKKIILVPDIVAQSSLWAETIDFEGVLGLELRQNLLDPGRLALKRILDIILALVGGFLILPFLLAIAAAVRLDSKGPAVYGHKRLGFAGKQIKVFKFRTMAANADQILHECLEKSPEMRAEWEQTHKLRNDPRITRMGRLLRKFSLDELPQLWNVIRGELSLVGPRPIVREEIAKYDDLFSVYMQVRPGITGLWQVSGRNNTSYTERIKLDTYYIRNWSIWLDIYVMCRTLPIVMYGKGAY